MSFKTWKLGLGILAGFLASASPAVCADPLRLTGSLVGFVSNTTGVAQMGATVLLYNRYERLVGRTLTNEKGAFGFDSLTPDTYSIRVSLASFVPALKKGIAVQPGMRSFLAVNLAGLFSSVELVYAAPGQGALMSDDWKWVLRSSVATRSVMRITPRKVDIPDPNQRKARASSAAAFSATRGVVKVSAGDQGTSSSLGHETDLGTAFALATSIFGSNQIQFSGNLGYGSAAGIPATSFSTRYSRTGPAAVNSPEVQLTMRQVFLPARVGAAMLGDRSDVPALRTMSFSVHDRTQIMDDLALEYGATLESVSYLERLHYFSPFARATYDLGGLGRVQVGYNSGAPPLQLLGEGAANDSIQQDLANLALFPRVSLRDQKVKVQRSDNLEIGYRKVVGKTTLNASVYQETMTNAALTMSGASSSLFSAGDLLPDLGSRSSIFNIGTFHSRGFMASATRDLFSDWTVTLAYGNGGVLRTEARQVADAEDLRGMVRAAQRHWASTRIAGTIPGSGTRVKAGYMWTDYRALTPAHTYITETFYPQTGLNVSIRQPIPYPGNFLGRVEASAELRNLLAQGYLPIDTGESTRLLLIHSPRAVRGGLSFIF